MTYKLTDADLCGGEMTAGNIRLAATIGCHDVKRVLKVLWPEAFEEAKPEPKIYLRGARYRWGMGPHVLLSARGRFGRASEDSMAKATLL